jgi:hypothetical protein
MTMTNALIEAQTQLDAANAAYLAELQQDSNRSEGSGAQERRREERQQNLKAEIERCEQALELAKKTTAAPPSSSN